MYYHDQHNCLFRQNDLSSFLRGRFAILETEIKEWSFEKINSAGEQSLVDELLEKYTLHAPILKENEIDIDARESEIEVPASRVFNDERYYKISGLKISVRIPFKGDANFFNYRPSTYSISGTPKADIERQIIVLRYETAEKDPEKIKDIWKKDIKDIKQNLEWVGKDFTNFNTSLESNMKTLVFKRKKEAEENQSLINKIKN